MTKLLKFYFKTIPLRHSGKPREAWRIQNLSGLGVVATSDSGQARMTGFKMTSNNEAMKQSNNGFTLVELLIYIGMMSILFTVLTQIFGSILDAQFESEATSSVQQDGRFILSRLAYDIRRADDIVVPAALGNQSTSLQLTIGGVNYTYALNSGDLELTEGAVTNKINGSETTVSSLEFTRLGNSGANAKNTVQIEYTVTTKVIRPKGLETKDYQTTIGIR